MSSDAPPALFGSPARASRAHRASTMQPARGYRSRRQRLSERRSRKPPVATPRAFASPPHRSCLPTPAPPPRSPARPPALCIAHERAGLASSAAPPRLPSARRAPSRRTDRFESKEHRPMRQLPHANAGAQGGASSHPPRRAPLRAVPARGWRRRQGWRRCGQVTEVTRRVPTTTRRVGRMRSSRRCSPRRQARRRGQARRAHR